LESSAEKFGKFCREVWKVLQRSLESSAEKFHRLDLGVWK
jgi:hypothetical protein